MEILPEEKIISYQINEQDVEVPAVSANVFLKNVLCVFFKYLYESPGFILHISHKRYLLLENFKGNYYETQSTTKISLLLLGE